MRHVVLFRWKSDVDEAAKARLRDGLGTMPEKIHHIRSYRFGDDAGLGAENFDFAVVADFDDGAGFSAYVEHPAHVELRNALITPIVASRASVQFAWNPALPSDLPA